MKGSERKWKHKQKQEKVLTPKANILTQMDITTDGYGFMLTFGNLVWVPFLFGVQARYLAFNPIDLGLQLSAFIFVWVGVGLWIFRSANGEKDAFRNGRNPKSESGTVLSRVDWGIGY